MPIRPITANRKTRRGLPGLMEEAPSAHVYSLRLVTSDRRPLSPAHQIFIDELREVRRNDFIRCIGQVTNKVLNSTAQSRTGHQVSTPLPFTSPPSSPSRPGTSTFIDCCSEGSLTVNKSARRWTSKDICSRCRRMSFM